MTDAIDVREVLAVLRIADAGGSFNDSDLTALTSVVSAGLIDDDGNLTSAGRAFLTKFGPLYPEEG